LKYRGDLSTGAAAIGVKVCDYGEAGGGSVFFEESVEFVG
jgi:hypothetical protein